MAGAIAFNVLIAFVPLILAMLGIAGSMLRLQDAEAADRLLDYLLRTLPPVGPEFVQAVRQMLVGVMEQSVGLLSVGMIFLIWVATRLVGTLRTALRQIFDVQQDRGIVAGKLFDLQMVVVAGALFTFNLGLTIALEIITRVGLQALALESVLWRAHVVLGRVVPFFLIWAMFLLIYRYLPARRIRWETALVAASFTAVSFELMKQAFAWYVTSIANYGTTFGNLANLLILFLWIYYYAVAFILGGEVAQAASMQRIRRRQKERLT
jgi:membrane protein